MRLSITVAEARALFANGTIRACRKTSRGGHAMATRALPIDRGSVGGFPLRVYCLVEFQGEPDPTIQGSTQEDCWRTAEKRLGKSRAWLKAAGYKVERIGLPDALSA